MKIVFLGMGEVAKCALHLLREFISVDARDVYIAERNNETAHPAVNAFIGLGATYLQVNLTRENTLSLLRDEIGLRRGDLVIDLTTDTDVFYLTEMCLENGWMFLNTCIENAADTRLVHHVNHAKMASLLERYRNRRELRTCVFDHGMNPGLVSSLAKKGLVDIAELVLAHRSDEKLEELLAAEDFSALAEYLGLEVLHCSETDNQSGDQVPADVFVNTWSCPGFLVEATAPLQVTWGSHERNNPPGTEITAPHMLMSETPAWQVTARSFVHDRETEGMVIPHEEIITLRKFLERPGYAPTICYVYEINPHTRRCFEEGILSEQGGLVLTPAANSLRGFDKVGCLFVLNQNPLTGEQLPWSYWCGSILETTDPVFSATVIQVAAGVLSAVRWMSENSAAGICFPEDLPYKKILSYAAPRLGEIFSAPVPFRPQSTQFTDFILNSGIRSHLLR